ncbi:uncharacterized protein [Haliotis cracherodii]|uniref:uncharacterized protein n=1 Tax=Haliotis cracherodii TaxID=6455 RepID=UPI0039E92A08
MICEFVNTLIGLVLVLREVFSHIFSESVKEFSGVFGHSPRVCRYSRGVYRYSSRVFRYSRGEFGYSRRVCRYSQGEFGYSRRVCRYSHECRGIPRECAGILGESSDIPRECSGILGESLDIHRECSRILGEGSDIPRECSGILGESSDIPRERSGILRSVQIFLESVQVFSGRVQILPESVQVFSGRVRIFPERVQVFSGTVRIFPKSVQVYSGVYGYSPSVFRYSRGEFGYSPKVFRYSRGEFGYSPRVYMYSQECRGFPRRCTGILRRVRLFSESVQVSSGRVQIFPESVQDPDHEATGLNPRQKISDDLKEDHRNNLYCVMIFQLVGATGNVLVVVAFTFMFNPNLFHYSDYIAASGSAVSLLSNIGILLADRKLRYDYRKLVQNDLLEMITGGNENSQIELNSQSLKTLIDISVRPEESLIIKVMELMKPRISSCGRCQDTCLSEDPDVPLCTCSCGPYSDSYPCSFLSFMLTPGFFEDTFQVVSSGWLLSSNIKSIADRVQNSDPPDNLLSMGSLGMICEFVELTLAVLSVFIVIAFSFYQCCSRQKDELPKIIKKVDELLGQASEDPPSSTSSV